MEAVSGISTEITEMVAAEQEQQRMQAKMLEAQKLESLGVLAGGIAHDFNNHLTGILGNVTLALFELGQDHAVAPLIEQIETAALTASHLTGQLLAYAGKGKFFVAALDLSRVVSEMSSLLHTSLPKKVRLDLDLSGQLPAIECDRSQLHQVIMNLVLNAAESIEGNKGVVTLRTSLVLEPPDEPPTSGSTQPLPLGRYVKLEVSDTGSGMDSETIGKIFDPFFTTRFAGRGLGLPATLGIVGGHGGAIYVRSVPGQGSVFEVYLPAADALPVDRRNDAPRVGARLDACFEGTILLADDEHLSRTATGNMLRKVGFRVIEAADGLSAVEAFRDHADEVSLVLLDLTMPRLGGEEVLAAIRLLRLDVPVVVMSGFARDEVSRRFASMPPAGVLEKPFGVDDLMLEVLQHLEVPALAMTP
ncbi:MAG: response regulator [Polyangiaceae bacterium]|nr:response regulator [Polyangiaceae bacterium]